MPVSKSNSIKEINDIRPVVLISVPFKRFENLVLTRVLPICAPCLDMFQFVYKENEDAIILFYLQITYHI